MFRNKLNIWGLPLQFRKKYIEINVNIFKRDIINILYFKE